METFVEDCAIMAIVLGPFFGLLAVGGIISDYVLPRCPRLIRFLEHVLDIDLGGSDDE